VFVKTCSPSGNREAARLAGIAVSRIKIIVLAARNRRGLAGVLLAARINLGIEDLQGLVVGVISALRARRRIAGWRVAASAAWLVGSS